MARWEEGDVRNRDAGRAECAQQVRLAPTPPELSRRTRGKLFPCGPRRASLRILLDRHSRRGPQSMVPGARETAGDDSVSDFALPGRGRVPRRTLDSVAARRCRPRSGSSWTTARPTRRRRSWRSTPPAAHRSASSAARTAASAASGPGVIEAFYAGLDTIDPRSTTTSASSI